MRFLLSFGVLVLLCLSSSNLFAQSETPRFHLQPSEKCNNYARHFCLNGSHEAAVNRTLLDMKKKGYRITPRLIKNIAKTTPSRLHNPTPSSAQ